jgi:hypothetical protein
VVNKEDFLESENERLRALLKQAGLDAEASEITKKLQQIVLAELHHRIKNMLAIVQSMVTQSLFATPSPIEAAEAITSRITALARTHDVLLSTTQENSLSKLLDTLVEPFGVEPFGATRFKIEVPDTKLSSKAGGRSRSCSKRTCNERRQVRRPLRARGIIRSSMIGYRRIWNVMCNREFKASGQTIGPFQS